MRSVAGNSRCPSQHSLLLHGGRIVVVLVGVDTANDSGRLRCHTGFARSVRICSERLGC